MNEVLVRLKQLIDALKLSDSGFAKQIGIGQSTISNLFQRNSSPKAEMITNVINTFGVDANWLLTGHGSMFLAPPTIGERLISERHKYSMDKIGWAELLSISPEVLERYEANKEEPSLDFLERLRGNFNVNPSWVLTGVGRRELPPVITNRTLHIKESVEVSAESMSEKAVRFKEAMKNLNDVFEESLIQEHKLAAGCEVCEIVNQLTPERRAKVTGYAEGLLNEQLVEQADEANHRAG